MGAWDGSEIQDRDGADEAREIGSGHTGGLECQAGKHEFSAESHREQMKSCQRALR